MKYHHIKPCRITRSIHFPMWCEERKKPKSLSIDMLFFSNSSSNLIHSSVSIQSPEIEFKCSFMANWEIIFSSINFCLLIDSYLSELWSFPMNLIHSFIINNHSRPVVVVLVSPRNGDQSNEGSRRWRRRNIIILLKRATWIHSFNIKTFKLS